MAWLTSPGLSKDYQNLSKQYPVNLCKKCSFRKPPRTHHCSWCNACILRYDHHCPWLNNCVGFYNHRYFYQFCCFMSIGCLYAGSFGYREYQISMFDIQLFRYMDSFFMVADIMQTMGVAGFITHYLFLIALGMGFVLLGLCWWHGRMIGRDATSLEHFLNQYEVDEDCEQGFGFIQTHDISLVENWKQFLGVYNMSELIQRVLFPSTHKPKGDGITMDDHDMNKDVILQKGDSSQSKQDIAYTSSDYRTISDSFVNKYRHESSSWQRGSILNSSSSGYKSQTSFTDRKNDANPKQI